MWRDRWRSESVQLRMSRPLNVDLDAAGSKARGWLLRALDGPRDGSFLVTLALLLLRIGPPPSSKSFFLSGVDQPGFKRFWHVLFEVGVCAFAPFGPLTAASGLARSHPAHVQGAANNWRTLGLSAFFPKTSDRYRVLCLIFPVCHKTKIGLPQLPSFVFPSHEQTLVLSLSLILIRHSS